jgi:hypothetical protein
VIENYHDEDRTHNLGSGVTSGSGRYVKSPGEAPSRDPRRWILLCLLGAALVATSTNARAVSIFLENVTVNPGDSVTLGVFVDAAAVSDIFVFQFGALIRGSAAAGLDLFVSQPEDFLPNAGSPPEFYSAQRKVDAAGAGDMGVSVAVFVNLSATPPLLDGINRVLDVTVTVPNTVPLGTVFDFEFITEPSFPSVNQFTNETVFVNNLYGTGDPSVAGANFAFAFDSLSNGAITVIPEPSTMLLLGSGLAGLGCVRRRSVRRQKISGDGVRWRWCINRESVTAPLIP